MNHELEKDFEKKVDKIKQGHKRAQLCRTKQHLVKFNEALSLFEQDFEDGT